jgi:nucleoid DNA-binding protein
VKSHNTISNNAILVKTKINKQVSRSIISDYLKIAKEAIIKGFEWEVPGFGKLKIVKSKRPPILKETKEKSVYWNGQWYKLDYEPIDLIKKETIDYKLLPKFKAEIVEFLNKKEIDYRFIS